MAGWPLSSSSVSFCHSSLACTLILQFLHPAPATSSNSSHHLNFGLLLLSPFPPSLVHLFAGLLSSIPRHLSSPSKYPRPSSLNFELYVSRLIHITEVLSLLHQPFSSTGLDIFCRNNTGAVGGLSVFREYLSLNFQ